MIEFIKKIYWIPVSLLISIIISLFSSIYNQFSDLKIFKPTSMHIEIDVYDEIADISEKLGKNYSSIDSIKNVVLKIK